MQLSQSILVIFALLFCSLAAEAANTHVKGEPGLRHRRIKKDDNGDKNGKTGGKDDGKSSGKNNGKNSSGGGSSENKDKDNGGNQGGTSGGNNGNNGNNGNTEDNGDNGDDGHNGYDYGGGYTMSNQGILEKFPCDELSGEQIAERVQMDSRSDSSCAGGCLRNYVFLVCDEDNSFPHVKCVCNANTYIHNPGNGNGSDNGTGTGSANGNEGGNTEDEDDRDEGTDNGTDNGSDNGTDNGSDTGTNNGANNGQPDSNECVVEFQGHGWGMAPSDPSRTPGGMVAGDCTASAHCGGDGQENICCLNHMCICGKPSRSVEEDCRP